MVLRKNSVFLCLLCLLLASSVSFAAPYIPEQDSEVLIQIPEHHAPFLITSQVSLSNTERLEKAKTLITSARKYSDPRALGEAQSLLKPLLEQDTPPADALILRASIYEYQHEFNEALTHLQIALEIDSSKSQAYLSKANIEIVLGQFQAARESCKALLQRTSPIVSLTCLTQVASLMGPIEEPYDTLQKALAAHATEQTAGVLGWSYGILADMAIRMGNADGAYAAFKQALAADPESLYLQMSYADFLFDQGDVEAAFALIAAAPETEAVLARKAIFASAAAESATDAASRLDTLLTASLKRNSAVHLREAAQLELLYKKNSRKALELAKRNWQTQREAIDTLLLAHAAIAEKDSETIASIKRWQQQTGFVDSRLTALFTEGAS